MAGPTDLTKVDPDTRCYALVGQFLQGWALMESALHECIQTAFKLTPTVAHILSANLGLRDKLNVVRTIVNISTMKPEEIAAYDKTIRNIGEYSPHRNMVAHDVFGADKDGTGVEFLTVKAKGKFDLPNIVWSATKFLEENDKVDGFKAELNKLNTRLKTASIKDEAYREAVIRVLMDFQPDSNWQPTPRSGGIGLLSSLFQPPPTPLDSHSTTPEKNAQTPLSPEKKDE